uniref:Pancreatic trypsin inhibitor n=1 Tax=Rhipicephalus zambeziensis TaxID=60191 RepID=A0A224YBH1_9ACAR
MRVLAVLAASPALMTLLLIGQTTGNILNGDSPPKMCQTPSRPFYQKASDDDTDILYIYNNASCLCESVLIDKKKDHTFPSRFSCVSQCGTGQGAPLCIGGPVNAVNDSTITSSLTPGSLKNSREEEDYNSDSEYHEFEDENMFAAFFYDAATMSCKAYVAHGMPDRSKEALTHQLLTGAKATTWFRRL